MKKNKAENAKKTIADLEEKKISRKEAIRKTGLIAVSAATMMMLLSSPEKAQATSAAPTKPPGW